MAYDESAALSVPTLTLQGAYVCLWHYHQGCLPGNRDHCGDWRECAAAMSVRRPHPFAAYSAMTDLRDASQPAMLRYEDGKPGLGRHRLPLACWQSPDLLFAAIRSAEEKHNQAIRDCTSHNDRVMAERAAGKPMGETQTLRRLPWPGVEVPLTEMVEATNQQAQNITTLQIGDIITRPDGAICEIVASGGRPALRPINSTDAIGGTSRPPTTPRARKQRDGSTRRRPRPPASEPVTRQTGGHEPA